MNACSRSGSVALVTFGPFAVPDSGLTIRSVVVARCLVEMGLAVHVFSIGEQDPASCGYQDVEPATTKILDPPRPGETDGGAVEV